MEVKEKFNVIIIITILIICIMLFGCASNTSQDAKKQVENNKNTTSPDKNTGKIINSENIQESNLSSGNKTQTNNLDVNNSTQIAKITTYTLSDISSHSSKSNCWMVISGKVYDVTKFVNSHPGGSAILLGCGKDATAYFSGRHSNYAWNLLSDYYIGDLAN